MDILTYNVKNNNNSYIQPLPQGGHGYATLITELALMQQANLLARYLPANHYWLCKL